MAVIMRARPDRPAAHRALELALDPGLEVALHLVPRRGGDPRGSSAEVIPGWRIRVVSRRDIPQPGLHPVEPARDRDDGVAVALVGEQRRRAGLSRLARQRFTPQPGRGTGRTRRRAGSPSCPPHTGYRTRDTENSLSLVGN